MKSECEIAEIRIIISVLADERKIFNGLYYSGKSQISHNMFMFVDEYLKRRIKHYKDSL